YFGNEFGTIGEILGLSKQDGEEIKRCYPNYLDVFTSYYKTARVPTKNVEEGNKDTYLTSHQCGFAEIKAPNVEVANKKGKEKIEHFGVKLEDLNREEYHDSQPNKKEGSTLNKGIKIKTEDTSSTSKNINPNKEDEIIYSQLDDARYDRALLRARVNILDSDRPFHRRTTILMEEEARLSRAAWAQSMDACDQTHSEGILLRTTVMAQQSEIAELQAADRRRQSMILELLKADHWRQRHLVETLKIVKSLKTQMIELQRQHGPAKDPAE
ncbi:hypothetical protein Tco_1527720, partial [Tanacetum coccineum]